MKRQSQIGVVGESSLKTVDPDEQEEQAEPIEELEREEEAEVGEPPAVASVIMLIGRQLVSRVSPWRARGLRGIGWMIWEAGR